MPTIRSAKRRMILSRKQAERNKTARSRIRTAVKRVRLASGVAEAEAGLPEAIALLDQAGRTNLMSRSRVARVKSQLQRRVNTLKAG